MAKIYTCPMHPEVKSEKPGRCPKCGMNLVESLKIKVENPSPAPSSNSYKPLIIVLSLILISSIAASYPQSNILTIVRSFMTGFFLVFAGFKLVDLKGFAQGYFTYDLLARKWFAYGYIYPFIELGLDRKSVV